MAFELPPKSIAALLNGLKQRVFDNNTDITPQLLKEQVFADVDIELADIGKLCALCAKVLKEAAFGAWEPSKLETILKQTPLNETFQEIFVRFWATQRPKILEDLRRQSNWSDSLLRTSWRIDLKTKAKSHNEVDLSASETIAIVELTVGKEGNQVDSEKNKLVRFELDKQQLASLKEQLDAIDTRLQSLSGGSS